MIEINIESKQNQERYFGLPTYYGFTFDMLSTELDEEIWNICFNEINDECVTLDEIWMK